MKEEFKRMEIEFIEIKCEHEPLEDEEEVDNSVDPLGIPTLEVGEPVSNSSSQPAIKEENVSADNVDYECPTQPSVLTDDYTCQTCGRSFNSRGALTQHSKYHTGESEHSQIFTSMVEAEPVFCCEVCVKDFYSYASLWQHMRFSHRKEASTTCGICLRICSDNVNLMEHVSSCHPKDSLTADQKRYSCQICGRLSKWKKQLLTHVKIHNLYDNAGQIVDPESVICCIDAKNKKNKKRKNHKQSAHRNSQGLNSILHCEQEKGGNVFPTCGMTRRHPTRRHSLTPNKCEVCCTLWPSKASHWRHMRSVHSECLPFICWVCLKICCSVPDLSDHVRDRHWPLSGSDYCCDICGRPYANKHIMLVHRKIHVLPEAEGGLPPGHKLESILVKNYHEHLFYSHFRCELCEDVTHDSRIELMDHIRKVHAGHPSLACDYMGCGIMLCSKSDLAKHREQHGQPYSTCSFCGKPTKGQANLRTHLKKHHPLLTKYLCCICLITLKDFDELRKHVTAKHKAVLNKPNICPVCVGSYSSKSNVLDHIRSHGEGFFPCDVCLKVFKIPEKQKRHTDSYYDDNSEEEEVDEEVDEQAIDVVKETESLKEEEKSNDEEDDTKTEESETTKRASEDEEMREDEIIDREDEEDSVGVPVKRQRRTFSSTTSFCKHKKTDHPQLISVLKSKSPEKMFLNSERKDTTNKMNSSGLGGGHCEVRRVYKSEDELCYCELDNRSFSAKQYLRQHLKKFHLNKATHACGVCLKLCKDYPSLYWHLALKHRSNFKGKDKNFTCCVCGTYRSSHTKLDQHFVINPGEELRTQALVQHCPHCTNGINSPRTLHMHHVAEHKGLRNSAGDSEKGGGEVIVPEHDKDCRSSSSSSSGMNDAGEGGDR